MKPYCGTAPYAKPHPSIHQPMAAMQASNLQNYFAENNEDTPPLPALMALHFGTTRRIPATDWNMSLAIVQTRVKHHAHALSIDKFFSSTDDTNPVRQHPASSIANPACMYTTKAAHRIIHLDEMRSFPVCFTLLADPDASISAKRDH